jgi:hypothetical protein
MEPMVETLAVYATLAGYWYLFIRDQWQSV